MSERHGVARGRRRTLAVLAGGLAAGAVPACRDLPPPPQAADTGLPAPRGLDAGPRLAHVEHARLPQPPLRIVREVPIAGAVHVPERFIGMHFHRWPHGGSPPPKFRFGTVRSLNYDPRDDALGVHWAGIHTAPDRFEWQVLDDWVAHHFAAGREMMYTLYGTPTWASIRPEKPDLYGIGGGNSRPRELGSLDRFVRALVTRYNGDGKRRIRYLEMWNEPDFPSKYWLDSPAELAALARAVFTAAKAVDPSLTVVWPGFVNWIAANESIPRVHRLYLRLAEAPDGAGRRGVDWGDALAVHYYATRDDVGQFIDHQESVRATRKAMGRTEWEIYLTEIGFEDEFGKTVAIRRKLQLIRQWIALSAAYGDRIIGLYSYENENNLAAPAFNAAAADTIDAMHEALCGKRLHRAALLEDGTVWLVRADGAVLRY